MPAPNTSMLSAGRPRIFAMSQRAMKIPWHKPIHLILLYRFTPRTIRVSGLEKFKNHASGQSSSMSRMMSRMTGRVRIVKNSAPGPPFSPRVCRTPYFCGTLKSCFHRSHRSMARLLMTKSAPARTSRRCVVFSSFNPRPLTSFIFFASAYIRSKFSASMSTRHSVAPANFSFVKISRKVGTPNDMLPAPIKTIFGVLILCTSS